MACPIGSGHEKVDLVNHRGVESSKATVGDAIMACASVNTVVRMYRKCMQCQIEGYCKAWSSSDYDIFYVML